MTKFEMVRDILKYYNEGIVRVAVGRFSSSAVAERTMEAFRNQDVKKIIQRISKDDLIMILDDLQEAITKIVESTVTAPTASEVHEVGDMIVHPKTKEIVTEDMFISYPNWRETDFIKVINCKEIKTPEGVALTGEINGQTFTATLSENDYFNGKNFVLTA
ncbi:hypothetical protein [Bacillus thuringiensis]|uniref:hypothetical protein n=1 Tax=Bacillus thuringiensis TaxID=1428 RepID=UPI003459E61A